MTEWIAAIVSQLSTLGPWGPVLFIALYVVASLTMAPAFVLTFAAGAVWGLWRGSVYVYIGALLGASAVHLLAARLARTRVTRWLDRNPRVAAVRRAVVAEQAVWIMFLLRLSPLIPFVQLNWALVLSGVRYRDYVLATIGMWPTIIMYVYYGKVAGDVAALATGAPARGPEYYAMLVIGLIATVLATTMVARAARKAMVVQAVMPD